MVIPILPMAAFALTQLGIAMNLTSQMRDITKNYGSMQEYNQMINDWHRNVPGRQIKYPLTRGFTGPLYSAGIGLEGSLRGLYGTMGGMLKRRL